MKKSFYIFIFILFLGILLRLIFLFHYPINCDEAFLGLTAKHISEFKEFPLFVSKAHYAGTLSCYIGALLFKLFGVSVYVFRSIAILFYWLPYLIFSTLISCKFRPLAHTLLVFLFISLPPPLITNVTSRLIGNYSEMLTVGSILFYLLSELLTTDDYKKEKKLFLLLAFFCGVGFWLSPGIIYCLFPILTLLRLKARKFFLSSKFILFIFLFCLGAMPAIIYNFQYPAASLYRFAGRILHLDRAVLFSPDFLNIVISRIIWRISVIPSCFFSIFKLIYEMATEFKIMNFVQKIILLPVGLCYFAALALAFFNRRVALLNIIRRKIPINKIDGADIYLIYILWFLVLYSVIVCNITNPDSLRYIIPTYIAFPFLLSDFLLKVKKYKKIIFTSLFIFLISTNVFLNLKVLKVASLESPSSYKKLIELLVSKKLLYGYSDEDIAYSLNFLSQEKIIYSATLFMEFEERYPEYSKVVDTQENVAYIINKVSQPEREIFFEKLLKERNISYKKKESYPFLVYYALSEIVRSPEIKFLFKDTTHPML